MKKQFFRVKQFAEQTFNRADKTEVLNYDELQIADQKIEHLRSALSAINKKIPAPNQGNDPDKKRRKTLEHHLGQLFLEHSSMKKGEAADRSEEHECVLFQSVLKKCGVLEENLADEYMDHESNIEERIGKPLQDLLDNELPNIGKLKRNLTKYILDKDSANNRYNATKKEALRDDMDEADSKVEQSRDALATEMFGFLSRENELACYFLQLLKIQRGYHDLALKHLEELIPELEQKIGQSPIRKVFGTPLEEHLRVTKKQIAFPLEICVENLMKQGMTEEGLFRIVGSVSRVKRLKSSIDANCLIKLIPEYQDVHVLASTLKMYLRELPEPLLTYRLHDEWLTSMESQEKVRVVQGIIKKLPEDNRNNLAYLMQFFKRLSEHHENKMTSSNIAIVIAPNLLWSPGDRTNMNMNNCALINQLVELFIQNVDTLFPRDVTDYVRLSQSLMWEKELEKEFERPAVMSLQTAHDNRVTDASDFRVSVESLTDSPRPNSRRKKTAAPEPPLVTKIDHDFADKPMSASYPSGTLPRVSNKSTKMSIATSTDDLTEVAHKKEPSLVSTEAKTVISALPHGNVHLSKAKPVVPAQFAQNSDSDKNYKTTVIHQVNDSNNSRPVAAPRATVSRNSSMKNSEHDQVQIRSKPEVAHKPEIPARPASLSKRSSADSHLLVDPATVHKTQCSVYSVAHKQQPSLVHLQNKEKFQPGHDNLIAEKEKFLGHSPHHQSNVENKSGDVNFNDNSGVKAPTKPGLPPKGANSNNKSIERLNLTKSSEKLDGGLANSERFNGNPKPTHVRTRSDGNLMDLSDDNNPITFMTTPPSPRSLNKPTQPPPPPPNIHRGTETNASTDL